MLLSVSHALWHPKPKGFLGISFGEVKLTATARPEMKTSPQFCTLGMFEHHSCLKIIWGSSKAHVAEYV